MKIGEYTYGLEMPKRWMLGRVTSVEKIGKTANGRTSYEVDAIDQESLKPDTAAFAFYDGSPKPFALIRILTTARRFKRLFGREPQVGDWLGFQTLPFKSYRDDLLPAWQAQLGEVGYSEQSRGYVTNISFVRTDGQRLPKSLGARAATSTMTKMARRLSRFPPAAIATRSSIGGLFRPKRRADCIRVRDVGQASFATLMRDSRPLAHFDAGWPVSFNGKTAPSTLPDVLGHVPVILSHWDWDHLHAYHKLPVLQASPWIVPVQPLGPGAAKVAHALAAAGLLFGIGRSMNISLGRLEICSGPAGNCNQTGLALKARLSTRETVLLTGDADYQHAPALVAGGSFDGLVVTHHGAHFSGAVPVPSQPDVSRAIVSSGRGNVYRHPRQASLDDHEAAGWIIEKTQGSTEKNRGDRWLP